LHRAGTHPRAGRLSQERQRLPGDRRRRSVASRSRQIEPGHHPQTARLLDSDPGTEILRQGAQAAQPVALLCHLPDRVLPQLRFQAQLTTVQIASSKPHTTAPTKPSKRLSMYSPPHDIAASIVRVAQGDGSRPNLVSVLQEGDKSANIHVRSGAIWRILV